MSSRMELLRAGPHPRGAKYLGTQCPKKLEHGGLRYLSTGGCVGCTIEANQRRRDAKRNGP